MKINASLAVHFEKKPTKSFLRMELATLIRQRVCYVRVAVHKNVWVVCAISAAIAPTESPKPAVGYWKAALLMVGVAVVYLAFHFHGS